MFSNGDERGVSAGLFDPLEFAFTVLFEHCDVCEGCRARYADLILFRGDGGHGCTLLAQLCLAAGLEKLESDSDGSTFVSLFVQWRLSCSVAMVSCDGLTLSVWLHCTEETCGPLVALVFFERKNGGTRFKIEPCCSEMPALCDPVDDT